MVAKSITLDGLLRSAVARWRDRPFLIFEEVVMSYVSFESAVQRAAKGLLALGVMPGDRVAIWMSNRIEWPIAQLAVTRCGAVLVPLNTRLRTEDLGHALRDSGAVAVVTQSRSEEFSYLDVVREVANEGRCAALRKVIVVGELKRDPGLFVAWADMMQAGDDQQLEPKPCDDPEQMAYILYTSGTTSLPKGVMLSHANLNNSLNLAGEFRDHDIILLTYPMFAITGCHNSIMAGLVAGATVVIAERFHPSAALDLIERYRCTVLSGVMTVVDQIVSLPSFTPERVSTLWRAIVFPRRPQHIPLLRRLGVEVSSTGYGMTETSGPLSQVCSMDEGTFQCEGRPWPGNEIRVRGPDGRDMPLGEAGAIFARSRQVMLGYFNNPEATAKAIDSDGWLNTGDVGRLNADGTLTWIGRSNEVYKCSGFNVAASEVEAFLIGHPAIAEVAVIGVSDRAKGEVGAAFVVAKSGCTVTPEDVEGFCKGRIASYKLPGHVIVLDVFPKTASGKVRKVELVARHFP